MMGEHSFFFSPRFLRSARVAVLVLSALLLTQCSAPKSIKRADVVVSVRDQKLGIYDQGKLVKSYKISTSKFGLGDKPGSNCTPLGRHEVVAKIGHGLPKGAVLKSRQWNGEVVKPNAPGRDPIVSRILWLSGQESVNRNAYGRCIYIHGTTEESKLGVPASYGCVRMAAKDVIDVFNKVGIGTSVYITTNDLPRQSMSVWKSKTDRDLQSAEPLPLPKAIPVEVDPNGRVIARHHVPSSGNKEGGPIGPPSPKRRQV